MTIYCYKEMLNYFYVKIAEVFINGQVKELKKKQASDIMQGVMLVFIAYEKGLNCLFFVVLQTTT